MCFYWKSYKYIRYSSYIIFYRKTGRVCFKERSIKNTFKYYYPLNSSLKLPIIIFLISSAKVPIVPVAIDAAFTSFEKNKKFKPSTVNVTFCKPIETEKLTKDEEKTLAEDIRKTIIDNLREEFRG